MGSGKIVVDMPFMSTSVEFPAPTIPGKGLLSGSSKTPVTDTRLRMSHINVFLPNFE